MVVVSGFLALFFFSLFLDLHLVEIFEFLHCFDGGLVFCREKSWGE